jgi:hypothetical protein
MDNSKPRSQGSLSLFGSLAEIGHKAEDDIFTWSQGLAYHYANLLEALADIEQERKDKILNDIWQNVAEKAPDAIKEKVSLKGTVDTGKVGETLSQILTDSNHPAIKGSGKDVDESLLNWVRLFALVDFNIYTRLENHLGTKDGYPLYMGLWEKFALAELDEVKKAVGISDPNDVDMDKIGELSKINMREILGEDAARSMTLKCEAAVSVNYYEAILKALGVFDRFSFTMDKFQCCGDSVCRVRFEKRA